MNIFSGSTAFFGAITQYDKDKQIMTGNPDANELGQLKEATWERLLEIYDDNPDSLEDELRGLIEAYLGQKEDGYGGL